MTDELADIKRRCRPSISGSRTHITYRMPCGTVQVKKSSVAGLWCVVAVQSGMPACAATVPMLGARLRQVAQWILDHVPEETT